VGGPTRPCSYRRAPARSGDKKVSAETVDGVTYTCASVRSGAMCVWTDEAWTGWARSEGPLDIGRLTDLVSSVHAAAT
jgi:hypothetical protein